MTFVANLASVPLDRDLARRLEVAGRKVEEWKDRRDELIREGAANGGTLREIAALVGLSNPGVLRIIRRGDEPEVDHIRPAEPDNLHVITAEENRRRGLPDQ